MGDYCLCCFSFLTGALLGFLLAVCVIDDLERFTIPGTDKTFVREAVQKGETQ